MILDTEYLLFMLGPFLLGASCSVDVLEDVWEFLSDRQFIAFPSMITSEFIQGRIGLKFGLNDLGSLMEDGAKFAGIVSWLVYFSRVVNQHFPKPCTPQQ